MPKNNYSLKWMAETGYALGLGTIDEVATHMEMHYNAYFSIANLQEEMEEFYKTIYGHEGDSIDQHMTAEDKARIDEDLRRWCDEQGEEHGAQE